MTKKQFLERITVLTDKLCDATNEHGYRSDAYNAVREEIHDLGTSFNRSRRRRTRGILAFCLFLLYCLFWLAWSIFFYYKN